MEHIFRADAVQLNMGSMLIGVILSAILLGLCLTQTFYYYINFPRDSWYHKWLVATVATLDTLHMVAISHSMYHYLVLNYNRPEQLDVLVWSIVIEALFTGVTGALVQLFYLVRIWRLSDRNVLLCFLVLFFILADAGCGTIWVILAMRTDTYDHLMKINPLTITINALSTASDCLIAASLFYFLWKARTGYKQSDTVINKVMIFVVNTGVLTSLCAIAALICLVVSPNTLFYASFYFCIGRLYTNAFLATLNARQLVVSRRNATPGSGPGYCDHSKGCTCGPPVLPSLDSHIKTEHLVGFSEQLEKLDGRYPNINPDLDEKKEARDFFDLESQTHKKAVSVAALRDGGDGRFLGVPTTTATAAVAKSRRISVPVMEGIAVTIKKELYRDVDDDITDSRRRRRRRLTVVDLEKDRASASSTYNENAEKGSSAVATSDYDAASATASVKHETAGWDEARHSVAESEEEEEEVEVVDDAEPSIPRF